VTVRESADGSSEALGYADRGSELEVLGGTSTWFLITQGDLTGYVAARYLTVDAEEAQAAVEAEENAQAAAAAAAQEAAAAAAAQAAAAAAAAASSAASDSSSSSQTETTQTDNACLTGGVLN
ncbi:MAG: SH3 domain-containing protein, partial [Clostridiales bacterium]|nr:SH3 domain-containing protein [Clostridiales bacterium]